MQQSDVFDVDFVRDVGDLADFLAGLIQVVALISYEAVAEVVDALAN